MLQQAQEDDKFWGEYANTLEKSLALDKERYVIHPNGHQVRLPEHFRQQSTWGSLRDIMNSNNGFLIVSDAVTTLVEASVFESREHARNVIYSTLYSHKKDVDKVRQGVYRFKNEVIRKPIKIKVSERIIKTDIAPVVKALKDQNPQMTKGEVLNRLLEMGFDFKGKNPSKSLAMTWVKLGYHKEGNQQSLLT